nr:phospholipase D family protein [Noviherbaspirillum massiliense]
MFRLVTLGPMLCLLAALLAGCSSLPSLANRSTSTAYFDTNGTRLGKVLVPVAAAHPGKSGIYPLQDARDAFAARVHLAQIAERSLDIQYYIWRKDMTGILLFNAVRAAADRGVRVRLLLDDNNTSGLDSILAALDAHPNIEIRLFNPFMIRSPRWIGYLTDFFRLNRRMHNKSFTADNQATIIGGRNVGDEYFGAKDDVLFADLDVMAVGPVVTDVSREFDRYWASASSYPVDRILPPADSSMMAELASSAASLERSPATVAYTEALRESPFVRELVQGRLQLEWAATQMVSDDPAKGLALAEPNGLLPQKLKAGIGDPTAAVDLVSPYFVLSAPSLALFTGLAKQGVKIRVLTNSLEATDVAAVHAGYAKRREALLETGVTLYELRRLSSAAAPRRPRGRLGSSSASSLHAKTFAVDHARAFVGSFNFDPRSAKLNTEMGFLIDSPALAQRIETVFDTRVPEDAYEVRLAKNGQLVWIEREDGRMVQHDTEPGTGFWLRAEIWFLSLLPIEWLL